MVKEKASIVFEASLLSELKKEAKARGVYLYDIVNEACKLYLQQKKLGDIEKIYTPIIERAMATTMKNFENRLAGLMAKNALDSGMTMLMVLQDLAAKNKVNPNELYRTYRNMAVKHVSKREELAEMLSQNKTEKNEIEKG